MKKFILSSVVLLLFILISGCDKNDKNVEFSVYEFYFGNHSIFRHDNFIGCFSADKIKMSARK